MDAQVHQGCAGPTFGATFWTFVTIVLGWPSGFTSLGLPLDAWLGMRRAYTN
jgi:hypothetical protein